MMLRAFAIGLLTAFCASLWLRAPAPASGIADAQYLAALRAAHASHTRDDATLLADAVERVMHASGERCRIAPDPVNVIDVSVAAATPELVAQMIRMTPAERVTVVGDRRVADDLTAGALIAERVSSIVKHTFDAPLVRGSGEFLDVTIEGPAGARRVLVLFH